MERNLHKITKDGPNGKRHNTSNSSIIAYNRVATSCYQYLVLDNFCLW